MQKKILITLTLSVLVFVLRSRLAVSRRFRVVAHGGTAAERRGYNPCDRYTSKDDCGERNRHAKSRSQPVERNQLPSRDCGQNLPQVHFAVGGQLVLSHSDFNNMFRAIEPGSMALIPPGWLQSAFLFPHR